MAAWHLFLKESCLSYWKGTLNQTVQQFYNSKHEISRNQQNCWLELGLFRNIKHQGTKAILKGFLALKKRNTFYLNLSQICQKQLPFRWLFNLHQPFLITEVPFCQTKLPYYWGEEHFSYNSFIQFFNFQ